jgi:hypothetical protein
VNTVGGSDSEWHVFPLPKDKNVSPSSFSFLTRSHSLRRFRLITRNPRHPRLLPGCSSLPTTRWTMPLP